MSTITHIPTYQLREGDLLLVGASMVSVETVEIDAMDDDAYWITACCISGNFDQWDNPVRVEADRTWQVLNADPR